MKATFTKSVIENKPTLSIKGDLVAHSSQTFKEQLQGLLEEPGDLALSLQQIKAIDVTAIQLIRVFKSELEPSGRKVQIHPPEQVDTNDLLTRTGLSRTLESIF